MSDQHYPGDEAEELWEDEPTRLHRHTMGTVQWFAEVTCADCGHTLVLGDRVGIALRTEGWKRRRRGWTCPHCLDVKPSPATGAC